MNWGKYLKSYEGTKAEQRGSRILLFILSTAVLLLAYGVYTKDVVVVVKPYTLTGEAEVMKYSASKNYLESWGHFAAVTLGNVTPQNADFVKRSMGPLFHPSIYQDAIRVMDTQIEEIKLERITTSFEPRTVEYDQYDTKKVFVTGTTISTGPTGKPQKKIQTFEFYISIDNYHPQIKFMDVYAGPARVGRVLREYQADQRKLQAMTGGA